MRAAAFLAVACGVLVAPACGRIDYDPVPSDASTFDADSDLPRDAGADFDLVDAELVDSEVDLGMDAGADAAGFDAAFDAGADSSMDAGFDAHTELDAAVDGGSPVLPDVIVTPTSGLTTSEAAGTATFTIVLATAPTSNVLVGFTSSDAGEGEVSPAMVTFTSADWDTPRTVTVTGVDDVVVDGNVGYTIVTTSAVSMDLDYDGLVVADVEVTNLDDDMAGVTLSRTSGLETSESGASDTFTVVLHTQPTADVTISLSTSDITEAVPTPATLVFTSANYDSPQIVNVAGADDAATDGDQAFTILTGAAASMDSAYDGLVISDVTGINLDDDTDAIDVTPTTGLITSETGTEATFEVVLRSQPDADVVVPVSSLDASEGIAAPAMLTFTAVDWNLPQTVTVAGVDDLITDGDVSYSVVVGPATSSDVGYSGLSGSTVSLSNADDDMASVVIVPTSTTTTTESGGIATFTVELGAEPTSSVMFAVMSSDLTEGTTSAASLTFTTGDWNVPQTVTMTGVDDSIIDGDVPYEAVLAVTSTGDPYYAALPDAHASFLNTDNDSAGITVSPTSGLVTTEDGGGASFTIVLTSQPSANVTINLMSSNTAEGTVSPASVTFTTLNWGVARTVNISGVNDGVVDGNVAYTIVTAAAVSADPDYAGLDAADVSVTNNASTLLVSDCTHRWVSSTNLFSNFKLTASSTRFVVAGFDSMSFSRIRALSEVDGSVAWAEVNQGAFGFGANGTQAVFQNSSGASANFRGVTLDTNATFSTISHSYTGTGGWTGSTNPAVRAGGETLVQHSNSTSSWILTIMGGPGPIMGSMPSSLLVHHDPAGAYIEHLVIPIYLQFRPISLSDGRWAFMFAPGASGATVAGHVVAPSTTELITLTNNLAYDSSLVVPNGVVNLSINIPGTTVKLLNGSNYLRAHDDSGLVWSRDDCASGLAGPFVSATNTHVYSMRIVSGAWCGRTIPGGTGIAIATLDAATGATVAVRYVALPIAATASAVSLDGDIYIVMSWNGTTPYSACGDAFPITGSNGYGILAL